MKRSICVALGVMVLGLIGCGGGTGGTGNKGGAGGAGGAGGSGGKGGAGGTGGSGGGNPTASDMGTSPVVDMAPVIVGADKCGAASVIPMDVSSVNLLTTTKTATHDLTGPCAGTSGADVFFTFTLSHKELVYADTFGATWNTSLFFASNCGTTMTTSTTPGDVLCSDDACASSQSQVVALLNPGTYYLVLSGKATGDATIHFQHVQVGRGPLVQLQKGASTLSGTTSGNGSLFECAGAAAENSYWWLSCPAAPSAKDGGVFTGSLCGGATWDTIAYLQTPADSAAPEICSDDGCTIGVQSAITKTLPTQAGVNVFTVDGSTSGARGDYTVAFSRP